MIDVHCHLFNALSLPLRGILRSRDVSAPMAALLDAAIRALADRDPSLDLGAPGPASIMPEAAPAVEPGEIALEPMSGEECVDWLADRVPESLLFSADLPAALNGAAAADAPAGEAAEVRRDALATYLKGNGFGRGSVGELISFVVRLLSNEHELFQELESMSEGVQLFVYHLMDMEHSYADRPEYEYVRQLQRMRNLARASQGRLIGFAAFEPFRPGALRIVREAMENGYCGVKFYPPSGYRPIGNEDDATWPVSGREIDFRNLELFTYCTEQGVPILAHCTPQGFERKPGRTGRFSHPDLWGQVLEHQRFRTLSLCLAHAGGEAGWFDSIPDGGGSGSFYSRYAGKVVKLCDRFPNVYCEFSHMEPIMTPEGRRRFAYWLNAAITRFPTFASKIMFGSDFPMLLDEGPWASYLPSLRQAFEEDPRLRRHAEAFFRGNALRFLDLPRFVRRNHDALTSEERLYLLNVAAGDGVARVAVAAAAASDGGPGVAAAPGVPAVVTSPATGAGHTAGNPVDCIVIGAGMAGITAAREVMRTRFPMPVESNTDRRYSVLVLEASDRVGGRMHTLRNRFPIPVELGAELIHRANDQQAEWPVENFWSDVRHYGLHSVRIDKLQNNARSALIYFNDWGDNSDRKIRPGCDACQNRRFKAGIDALDAVSTFGGATPVSDVPVSDFIHDFIVRQRGFTPPGNAAITSADYLLTGTVPGDSDMLSAASLRYDGVKKQEHSSEEYHVLGGYDLLPGRMAKAEQIPVVHGSVVTRIEYRMNNGAPRVTVQTAAGKRYFGRTCICTVSVGALKHGALQFDPDLPDPKKDALGRLDMGAESKVVMLFSQRFWPRTMAILSNPGVPRHGGRSYFVPGYNQSTAPILTAFLTRSDADALDAAMPDGGVYDGDGGAAQGALRDLIRDTILKDLETIFKERLEARNMLPLDDHLQRFYCRSWTRDPFARGAASYVRFGHDRTVDVPQIRAALAEPTEPLFWAGEATAHATQPWSVHGAHQSGVRAAFQVRRFFVLSSL